MRTFFHEEYTHTKKSHFYFFNLIDNYILHFQKMVMDFNPNPPTMRWLLMIGFGLLYMNMIHSHSVTYDLPCHFLDSINITAGVRQTNGSILYDGILFANGQYSNVNYTLEYGKKHIPTDSHIRGCLCTYNRTCLRFCNEAAKTDFEHEILNAQNQSETVKLNKQFTIIDHHPCEEMFIADKYQIKHVNIVFFFPVNICSK